MRAPDTAEHRELHLDRLAHRQAQLHRASSALGGRVASSQDAIPCCASRFHFRHSTALTPLCGGTMLAANVESRRPQPPLLTVLRHRAPWVTRATELRLKAGGVRRSAFTVAPIESRGKPKSIVRRPRRPGTRQQPAVWKGRCKGLPPDTSVSRGRKSSQRSA